MCIQITDLVNNKGKKDCYMKYLKGSAPRVTFSEIKKKEHKILLSGKNFPCIYSWSITLQSILARKNYFFKCFSWWCTSRLRPCGTAGCPGRGLCACARFFKSSKAGKCHLWKQRWGCTVLRWPGQTKPQTFPSGSKVFKRKVNLHFCTNNKWWRAYFFMSTLSVIVHCESQRWQEEEWVHRGNSFHVYV